MRKAALGLIAMSCLLAGAQYSAAIAASATHACDDLGDAGWQTQATIETVREVDSAPYRDARTGNWFIDRTTTVLPFCNYFNAVGNYSLRSYTLSPEDVVEKVEVCRSSASGGAPRQVAPFKGRCPAS